ncbi:hypothetical protein DRQ16_04475 [bacterium]|nr:MAG: hypothetical protein DRQ16_04475 [bacterium]RKZ26416.1 MAG: hypothetical protein DRQ20_02990 [bacterium]
MKGVFFGCTTRSNPLLIEPLERFLELAGVEYKPLGKDLCCGAPLLLTGHMEEAREQAGKVRESAEGIDVIITPCPHCYTTLKKEYPHLLGDENPFKVVHFSAFAHELVKEGKITLKKELKKTLTYHDPCYVGRQGDGIYEEPREVIKAIKGVEFRELPLSRERSTCCGGGGLLRAYLPKLSRTVAEEKIERQVIPLGVDGIVTSCPFCYVNLAEGAEGKEIEVYDLPSLLLSLMEE